MAARKRTRRVVPELELDTALECDIVIDERPRSRARVARIDSKRLALPKGVRHWFVARTIGGDFDVLLATDKDVKDLRGNYGVMLPELGLIALDESSPQLKIVVTLVHEILHAVLSAPADSEITKRALNCDASELIDREEAIVALLAPRLTDCLLRSGLLRLPPIPRRKRSR